MNNITFTGIFCDDIRHEIGNKFTLVGCYSDEISFPKLPAKINRLCVHFSLKAACIKDLRGKKLKIEVLLKGNSIANLDVDTNKLKVHDEEEEVEILGGMELPPMSLEENNLIEIVTLLDGDIYSGRKLNVKAQSQPK